MNRIATLAGVLNFSTLLIVCGCGGSETYKDQPATENTPAGKVLVNDMSSLNGTPPAPGKPSPGGSPTYGTQSGMGLATGDSLHASGQGSGMMGFNGTGAKGTNGTISDTHDAGEPDKNVKDPVLPAQ